MHTLSLDWIFIDIDIDSPGPRITLCAGILAITLIGCMLLAALIVAEDTSIAVVGEEVFCGDWCFQGALCRHA
jgi:hypothetical protein